MELASHFIKPAGSACSRTGTAAIVGTIAAAPNSRLLRLGRTVSCTHTAAAPCAHPCSLPRTCLSHLCLICVCVCVLACRMVVFMVVRLVGGSSSRLAFMLQR
jgi:hypothetical protein